MGNKGKDGRLNTFYYPDPAASILILGLKLPQESNVDQAPFVEEPIAIPVGARTWPDDDAKVGTRRWPDVFPVHIELKAVDSVIAGDSEKKYPRLVSIGSRWLAAGERLLESLWRERCTYTRSKSTSEGARICCFRLGVFRLSANQLASWFDAIEVAVLAMQDNSPQGDADSACVKNQRLLDRQFPALPVPDKHLQRWQPASELADCVPQPAIA